MKKTASLFSVPYLLWLLLFVVAPVLMLLYQSFFDISGNFTLDNYGTFFSSWTYLRMSFNSVLYAAIITLVTLLISYPTAYLLTRLKHKQLWLMLVILPTWVNLLLKAYAFMGIFRSTRRYQCLSRFLWDCTHANSLYGFLLYFRS